MATIDELCAWLNEEYPGRDWDQECQRLVWNSVWHLSGVREGDMHTYPTATAARLASEIESTDAGKAPAGAIHYWRNPAEGHVGVALGDGLVLMTGTSAALGKGGVQKGAKGGGSNFGVTTVKAYTEARGNPYLGWARRNGRNKTIVGTITDTNGKQTTAASQETEDMLIQIKGKVNARRGGLYFVSGGKATFLGGPVPAGVPLLSDESQIKALQSRVTGLA